VFTVNFGHSTRATVAFTVNPKFQKSFKDFKYLIVSNLKTKRNAQHRSACYPLAIPFRPVGTKISTIK